MSDLQKYISNRKAADQDFLNGFDEGYQALKIGVLLKQAREASGLTQQEIAEKELELLFKTLKERSVNPPS